MKIRNKFASVIVCIISVIAVFMPNIAFADMQGTDTSNYQCGINLSAVPGDFHVIGLTWGSGNANNVCLRNGVNTDAARQANQTLAAGKQLGLYAYAMGGNAATEARYFVDNAKPWIGRALLALDWESVDNPAFGNPQWPRDWAAEVYRLTGVHPVIYTSDSAYWQVAGMPKESNTGIWIAQYANMLPTGYQSSPWRYGTRGEVMRQYTSSGRLPNWSGMLDLNIFAGDISAWQAYARGDGTHGATTNSPSVSSNSTYSVVVHYGDTMSAIAYRTNRWPLSAWSVPSGNINLIYPNQIVTYNGVFSSNGYIVKSGDTLWSIFGANWQAAAQRNHLNNPNLIYVGQRLI